MITATQLLREHGLKATTQRQAILSVVLDHDGPLSAETIYSALQPSHPDLCLSTVYRNLNQFVDKQILIKVPLTDDRAHYCVAAPGHQHYLICLNCHEVIELDQCPVHDYEEHLMEESRYRIINHRLTFYGYCAKCRPDA